MGVKIQSRGYLSELYSMGNFSEESSVGSWSLLYEDRLFKPGQCYNGFSLNTGFDREFLRQTMLKQENVFRKQVVELHRLYKVQTNLMNDIQRVEGYKYSVQDSTTPNNVLSSPIPSFDTQIMFPQNIPGTSSSSCGPSTRAAAKNETPNFPKERSNTEVRCLTVNGIVSDKEIISTKLKGLPRRLFDLQRPAEEYVDIEDDSENNVEMTPRMQCNQSNNRSINLEAHSRNFELLLQRPNKFVADLNEPVHESETAHVDAAATAKFLRPTYPLNDIENKSPYLGIPMNNMKHSHLEIDGKRIEWLSNCSKPEDNNDQWKRQTRNFTSSPDMVKTLPRLKEFDYVDTTNNFSYTSRTWDLNRSTVSASCYADGASRFCDFRHAASFELGCSSSKPFPLSDKRDFECGAFYNAASVGAEDHLPRKLMKGIACKDVGYAKDINLNVSLPNGLINRVSVHKTPPYLDDEGPVWLKSKPNNNSLLHSISCASDIGGEVKNSLLVDGLCPKKTCDSFLFNKPIEDFSFSTSLSKQNENEISAAKSILHAESSPRVLWNNSKDELLQKSASLGFDLNIDASAASCTEFNQLEISSNNVTKVIVPDVNKASKKGCIDLEAPPTDDMLFAEEEETIIAEKLTISDSDTLSNLADAETAVVQSAAEAIVTLSTTSSHKKDQNCSSSICNKASNCLSWFADLVLSQANDNVGEAILGKPNVGTNHEQSGEDSDYFAEMTLKLPELAVSRYCSIPFGKEDNKEEAGPSSLFTRRRRGGSRRGRQKRDFQRDILPGLVTLSRHEVTDDLQILEGLLRDAGSSFQLGLSRRNGSNGRGRGRRRLRGSAPATEPPPPPPPPPPLSIGEVETEGMCLQGWGKTTRRARRQRLPTVNATCLLT